MTDLAQNENPTAAAPTETCPVPMSDGKPCGRRSLGLVINGIPYCLMHTPMGKDDAAFQAEFQRTLDEGGSGVADFTRVAFPNANYAGREFKAHCVFSGATFTQDADFRGATFRQKAIFGDATFTQKAFFGGTTFEAGVVFSGATFTQNADFSQATFTQNADFIGATFARYVDFNMATFEFEADANFSGATFTQNARFPMAIFTGDTRFDVATFKRDAEFFAATFAQNASFDQATFKRYAGFTRTSFRRFAIFRGAKFFEAAEFRETEFRRDEERFPGPVFSLAQFSQPKAIVFSKTYMGQALFHSCDVSKFNFSSVEWRKRKKGGKRMVFEEVVTLDDESAAALKPEEGNPDKRDYGLIAELYQQLKKNYDERKDYWTAGDFHYGEMEMKRLHSQRKNRLARLLWRNLGLVAWYKYASQYGESYMRPVAVLLIVLAIFTLLFPWAGLDRNENTPHSAASARQQTAPPATTSELSYKRFTDFIGAYPGRKWVAPAAFFGNSLMTVLSVAGFQRELKYEPSYPWGRALALLELLLTSTVIALFLLAVRRQFKR